MPIRCRWPPENSWGYREACSSTKPTVCDVLHGHAGVQRIDGVLEDHLDLVHQLAADVFIVELDLLDLLLLDRVNLPHAFLDLPDLRIDLLRLGGIGLGFLLQRLDLLVGVDAGPLDLLFVPAIARTDANAPIVYGTGGDVIQADDAAARGGLAAAGLTHDAQTFAFLQIEGDVGHSLELLPVHALAEEEEHLQVPYGQQNILFAKLRLLLDPGVDLILPVESHLLIRRIDLIMDVFEIVRNELHFRGLLYHTSFLVLLGSDFDIIHWIAHLAPPAKELRIRSLTIRGISTLGAFSSSSQVAA